MDYQLQRMYRELWPPVCEMCLKNEAKWWCVYCSQCHSKHYGKKRKRKLSNSAPSKPLKCGGYGYSFRFDRMIQPQDLRGYHLAGKKVSKDQVYLRTHRKRQRRVNVFLINEALEELKTCKG